MIKKTKIHRDFFLASLIFTVVMVVYLFTLAPTIYLEDAGELITAAATLGIAHPSGYPLYVLLGKLFTFIPLGTIAWRVNLMSAVFGALTASLLYLIIQRLIKKRFIAVPITLLLPFSPIFWSQSVIAEVYTLNTFLVALIILLLIIWQNNRQEKYLLWLAFIYGLSLTNHTMMALLAPALAIFIWLVDRDFFKKPKLLLKMLGLFILGLSVYLYLPLRSLQNPVLDWGSPDSLSRFWAHISRKIYGDISPLTQEKSKLALVAAFFFNIIDDFFWPTFILALLGLGYLFKSRAKMAILTLGIFLLNSLGIIIFRSIGWNIEVEYIFRVYYLPCFLMVIVWLAVILAYFYQRAVAALKRGFLKIIVSTVFFIILFSLPVSFLLANYETNDKSDFWLNYDYARKLLASLEPQAVLVFYPDNTLTGDTELFSLMYLQLVEKFRPDVFILTDQNFFYQKVAIDFPPEYFQKIPLKKKEKLLEVAWGAALAQSFPVYANFGVTQNTARSLKLVSRSNGIIYRIYPSLEAAKASQEKFPPVIIRNLDEKKLERDYSAQGFLAHYYYNLANFYLEHHNKKKSQFYLLKAIELDPQAFSSEYQDFVAHRQEWQGE